MAVTQRKQTIDKILIETKLKGVSGQIWRQWRGAIEVLVDEGLECASRNHVKEVTDVPA